MSEHSPAKVSNCRPEAAQQHSSSAKAHPKNASEEGLRLCLFLDMPFGPIKHRKTSRPFRAAAHEGLPVRRGRGKTARRVRHHPESLPATTPAMAKRQKTEPDLSRYFHPVAGCSNPQAGRANASSAYGQAVASPQSATFAAQNPDSLKKFPISFDGNFLANLLTVLSNSRRNSLFTCQFLRNSRFFGQNREFSTRDQYSLDCTHHQRRIDKAQPTIHFWNCSEFPGS